MDLPTIGSINLLALLPVIMLLGGTCVLLLVDLFIPRERKYWTAWLALVGVFASATVIVSQTSSYVATGLALEAFNGMVVVDGFSLFLQALFLVTAFLGILIAMNYLPRRNIQRGEYYSLILFSTAGMMIMSMAADLMVIFLALELLSIPLYVLSAFLRPDTASEESGMKYFLLGAFASGFLVYGIALTYGGTGTTSLQGVVNALAGEASSLPLALAGMAMILVGLGFKVAVVPFHMWTPDVYQGAPTPVTAFMSVGAKAGGFAALLRVLVIAMPSISSEWGTLAAVIAILTMILGNFVAISQSDIKRMLAYSSIAHAGYIMLAVSAAQVPEVAPLAVSAAIFYLLTYAFTNLGAFAVVIALEKNDGTGTQIDDYAGLGKTHPVLALAMTLFMLSLTGMPVSAGLVGKFFVFKAAIQAATGHPWILAGAIIGVLTSVVSAFYYMRVVLMMYMREGDGQASLQPALTIGLAITALVTLVLGVIPTPLFNLAQNALLALAG